MSHHACDLCSADSPRPLPQDPRIKVCGACGFLYVDERRSSAEIAASWGEIYQSGQYDPNWPAVKARLYYVAEWIDQNIGLAGKDLLDIGAGKGQFMSEARKRGASVFGIEPTADGSIDHIWRASVEDCDPALPLGKFSIVTINWTLENCGDCMAMLRFAREHCKPDGWVVVATGSRIGVPFKKPLSKYLNPDIPADLHCFRWSHNSLRQAMLQSFLLPAAVNDFEQHDCLIEAALPCNSPPAQRTFDDDPNEILSFFATWAKFERPGFPTTWSRK